MAATMVVVPRPTIQTFVLLAQERFNIKYDFIWASGFKEEMFKMFIENRVSVTPNISETLTFTFSSRMSSSSHLVNHTYQICILEQYLRNLLFKLFPYTKV